MTDQPRPRDIVVFLSAPPEIARGELQAIRADHAGDRITVYMRAAHRPYYEDLLDGCFAYSDKPSGSKRSFITELRGRIYHEAIVLDFGQWDFYPARCLFFLARALAKTVRTERGTFPFSRRRPIPLVRHLLYRSKHRTGAVADMPPGAPLPFVLAAYRKTVGRIAGTVLGLLEYGWRRLRG